MNLSNFLNFNHTCPVCLEPLNLYMQWIDSVCFKGSFVEDGSYEFKSFKGTNRENIKESPWDDSLLLKNDGSAINSSIYSKQLLTELKTKQMYLFFLCNEAGFQDKSWGDYEINLYKGCYYRSTPLLEYKDNNSLTSLEVINPDHADIINKDEAFAFKFRSNDLNKVYMLNLDYETKNTFLWHYTATDEQRAKENFKPKLFEKELPLLKVRPKLALEERESLQDRFDSWILLS